MFMDLLPKVLPSLKHISFAYFNDPIGEPQFPNCPVLERAEMLYHQTPSPYFWGTNFYMSLPSPLGVMISGQILT